MRRSLAIVAALLALPAVARADDGGDNYRVEIGAVDTLATGAAFGIAIGSHSQSIVPFYAATALAVVAGPIDHAVHDDWGRAGLSLGAHVLFPVLGGAIGDGTAEGKGLDGLLNVFAGVAIGHLVAIGVDVYMAKTDPSTAATPRMISFGGHF
jgi:hypothetical protein